MSGQVEVYVEAGDEQLGLEVGQEAVGAGEHLAGGAAVAWAWMAVRT